MIFTRADGKTVIELWTNGARVEDRDQLVNQDAKEAEVASSNPKQEIESSDSNVETSSSNTQKEVESSDSNVETLSSNIQKEIESSNSNVEVVGSKPLQDRDSELLLKKLRSAIRSLKFLFVDFFYFFVKKTF